MNAHQWAFEEHMHRSTNAPILAHFDPLKPSKAHTDAPPVGAGAVLVQRDGQDKKALAYACKAFYKAPTIMGQHELELFAVVYAIINFHYYLEGVLPSKWLLFTPLLVLFLRPKTQQGAWLD